MNNCKFYKQEKYESLDGGFTWSAMGIYKKGELIEVDSPDCTTQLKFYATYNDSTTYSAACDSSSVLTSSTTRAHSTPYSGMTTAEIGSCVTSIGEQAFYECYRLTSVEIPNSVTTIGASAFTNCNSLTSINIPNSVTSLGNDVFAYCSSLSSVTIPNSITSISWGAFANCMSLSSLTIPNSVTSIDGYAFILCLLNSVTIPSGVTSINTMAFAYCFGLTSVTCLATTPPTLGSSAFDNTNDCPIYVPSGSVETYKAASGWSNYANRIQAIPTPTPVFDGKFFARYNDSTTYSAACDSNTELTTATTRAHTTVYGVSAMTSAEIGSCVTSIGASAFYPCTSLTSVTIPNSVTSIGNYAFQDCRSLTSIDIPSGVTTIGYYAFKNCRSLTSIDMPNRVTTIGDGTFSFCLRLSSIDIPSGVTNIGEAAFYNCSGFTSITIEATTPPTLGDYAFNNTNNCPIYVPSASVDTYKSAWSSYASRIQAIPT